MRITGGVLKGRKIAVPNGKMAIRPAMDMMRESVFNIIAPVLPEKSFLDLFSGSGSIALEAVSRGATSVSLCEKDKAKASLILKNVTLAEELGVHIDCHFVAVELFLKRYKNQSDFIFLDPPFPYKFRKQLLQTISERNLLSPSGMAIIHHPKEAPLPCTIFSLERFDQREYGRSIVDFFRISSNYQN